MRKDWLKLAILDRGLLSARQIEEVDQWPLETPAPLIEKLYRSALLTDQQLLECLLEQGATDASDALEADMPPPAVLGALDRDTAASARAIPLEVNPPRLVVGMLDPSDSAALERMSFFSGLLVEPRAIRASVLFNALSASYGIEPVEPDLQAFSKSTSGPYQDDDAEDLYDELPPPSANLPEVNVTGVPAPKVRLGGLRANQTPDDSSLALPEGPLPDYAAPPPAQPPESGWVIGRGPYTPALATLPQTPAQTDTVHQRDTLPPQVLPILMKHFRTVLMFLVRDDVAVGWDGAGPGVTRDDIRDVLVPLTAPSAFARAWSLGLVSSGSVREPTTTERMVFRMLAQRPPRAFVVIPIRVGDTVSALIYGDLDVAALDEDRLAIAHQVGLTLADALAPLVAEDRLFG